MVKHENKLNQLEEKEHLCNEMVQKTNLIVFQLDRQEQYVRIENILIADELEIDLQGNEIQRVHRLGQKRRNNENPRPIIARFVSYKKEASFLLTNGMSKLSNEDSTTCSFVKISHLYGKSY